MNNKYDLDNLLHKSMDYCEKPSMDLLDSTKLTMKGNTQMNKNKFKAIPTLLLVVLVSLALPATAWGAYTLYNNNFRIIRGQEIYDELDIDIDIWESGESIGITVTEELSDDAPSGLSFSIGEGEDGVFEVVIEEFDVDEVDDDFWNERGE